MNWMHRNQPAEPIVRDASMADQQRLANLIHFEAHVHRHLDWRPPLEWLGSSPYLVVERAHELMAALACPPDPLEMSWVRLFVAALGLPAAQAWQLLWPAACRQLEQLGSQKVAAIALQPWFGDLLEASDFKHQHDVIMLLWEQGTPAPVAQMPFSVIRPMDMDDLDAVYAVDAAAFNLEWRNSRAALEMALQQAAVASVVEAGTGIIGYQISTAGPLGGHLARLAVHPQAQGQGIGYTLLCDTLNQFTRRGVMRVSVNTQSDNAASLALYTRAGFRKTGEAYRVYQYALSERIC